MARQANANQLPVLDAPRSLSQEPVYNLDSTVRGQFDRVYLKHATNGQKAADIVLQDKKKEPKIGESVKAYVCALVIGMKAGLGDAPGGTVLWADENADAMKGLNEYILVAEPNARGSTIEAPLGDVVKAVRARANVIRQSLEKHPVEKRVKDTSVGSEGEEIEITLL